MLQVSPFSGVFPAVQTVAGAGPYRPHLESELGIIVSMFTILRIVIDRRCYISHFAIAG